MHELEQVFNSVVADSEYQKMSGDDQDDIVIEKLDSLLSTLDLTKVSDDDAKSSKNTTKYRQILVKQFLGTAKMKMCPRCLVPVRYFRSEYHSRLYLKPLSLSSAKKYINNLKAKELAAKEAKKPKKEDQWGHGMYKSSNFLQ